MGSEAWCPAQLCKCPCPCGGGTQKAPRLPCCPSLPAFPRVAPGPACINQEHLQVPSSCYGNSGWSRLGNGGQPPPPPSVVSVWIRGSRHTRYLVLQGSSILITLTVRFFCGLRLNAASFLLFAFPSLSSLCTVYSWNLAASRGSKPHTLCHFLCTVVGQTERGNSTPRHGPPQVPGKDTWLEAPVGRGCVCFLCVHTGQVGLCC